MRRSLKALRVHALFRLPVWILMSIAASGASGGSGTYYYDDLGRLKAVQYEDGTGLSYRYDAAGNRTEQYFGPLVTFAVTAASVSEGNSITFTVTKSGDASIAASVGYETKDISAQAGVDYTAPSANARLEFASGQTNRTFSVSTTQDAIYEGVESLRAILRDPSQAGVVATQSVDVAINDNDPAPVIAVASGSADEGDPVVLVLSKTNSTALTHSVTYSSAAGSAAAGTDFSSQSGTVSFAPAEMSKTISIPVTEDLAFEGQEAFTVSLSSPTNGASLGQLTATATINEDDPAPAFAIDDPAAVTEFQPIVFTVTKANATALTHTVTYSTASGTATAGSDFSSVSGTLSFGSQETSKTITVNTIDDAALESATEAFTVQLSAPSAGAIIADASGIGTISDNDSQVPGSSTVSSSEYYSTDGSYTVSWTAVSGNPTRYDLYETKYNRFGNLVHQNKIIYSGLLLSKLAGGGSGDYWYHVKACNALGCSAASNSIHVTVCLTGTQC